MCLPTRQDGVENRDKVYYGAECILKEVEHKTMLIPHLSGPLGKIISLILPFTCIVKAFLLPSPRMCFG